MAHIEEEQTEEERLLAMIEEEYFLNAELYEPSTEEFEDPIYKQLSNLLLNKNKCEFPSKHKKDRLLVLRWFLETYTSQLALLNSLFGNWPEAPQSLPFRLISKK